MLRGVVTQALVASGANPYRAGAGLDVFEEEPLVGRHEFAGMPNVVLTPHIGSATRSSRLGMAMLAARNLVAWAEGRALITPVRLPDRS